MGRPSSLTPQVADRIIEAIRAGAHVDVAAAYAGVAAGTFYLWRAKGRRDEEKRAEEGHPDPAPGHSHAFPWVNEGPSTRQGECSCGHSLYSDFDDRMRKAEASIEVQAILSVRKHWEEQWTAGMTFLERRFPSRWRRRDRLEVGTLGDTEGGVEVEEEPLSVRLAKTLEVLERAGKTSGDAMRSGVDAEPPGD